MKFVICLLLALSSTVFGKTCSENFSEPVPYIVQSGDWLSTISLSAYGPEMMMEGVCAIAELNGIKNPNVIITGKTIMVPRLRKASSKAFVLPVKVSQVQGTPVMQVVYDDLPTVEVVEVSVNDEQGILLSLLPEFVSPVEKQEEILIAETAQEVQLTPEVQPQVLVQAAPLGAEARPGKKNKGGNYQTEVFVPGGLVEGIREGKLPFPAVLAIQKQEDGRWKRREEMRVQIRKVTMEKGIGFVMTLLTKQELVMDSALRVDFGEGYSFTFPGEYLVDKDLTGVTYVNQKLPRKLEVSYKSLNEFLPKKLGLMSKSLHFFPPLAPQLVMAGMGNPVPLAFTAIGITSNKFASRQAKVPKSVQVEQQEKIEMLESQVEDLSSKLNDLLTALQQNSKPVELAENLQ